jgi:hypothetical protein
MEENLKKRLGGTTNANANANANPNPAFQVFLKVPPFFCAEILYIRFLLQHP